MGHCNTLTVFFFSHSLVDSIIVLLKDSLASFNCQMASHLTLWYQDKSRTESMTSRRLVLWLHSNHKSSHVHYYRRYEVCALILSKHGAAHYSQAFPLWIWECIVSFLQLTILKNVYSYLWLMESLATLIERNITHCNWHKADKQHDILRKWMLSGGGHSYHKKPEAHNSPRHCTFPEAASQTTAKCSGQNMNQMRFLYCQVNISGTDIHFACLTLKKIFFPDHPFDKNDSGQNLMSPRPSL